MRGKASESLNFLLTGIIYELRLESVYIIIKKKMLSFSQHFKCRTQFRSRPIGGSSDFESAVLLQNKPIITADFLGGVSTCDIDREKNIKLHFYFPNF